MPKRTAQSVLSNSEVDQVALFRAATESKNEDHTNNRNSCQFIPREVALNKFCLKKERYLFLLSASPFISKSILSRI